MTPERLAEALERARVALEADDAVTASAALQGALDACAAARTRGLRLDAAALAGLREAHGRGEAAAGRARARLARALGEAGSARRATAAYRG